MLSRIWARLFPSKPGKDDTAKVRIEHTKRSWCGADTELMMESESITVSADVHTELTSDDIDTIRSMADQHDTKNICFTRILGTEKFIDRLSNYSINYADCDLKTVSISILPLVFKNQTRISKIIGHGSVIMDGVSFMNSFLWQSDLPRIDPEDVVAYVLEHCDTFSSDQYHVFRMQLDEGDVIEIRKKH